MLKGLAKSVWKVASTPSVFSNCPSLKVFDRAFKLAFCSKVYKSNNYAYGDYMAPTAFEGNPFKNDKKIQCLHGGCHLFRLSVGMTLTY